MTDLSKEDQELATGALDLLQANVELIRYGWRSLDWLPAWIGTGSDDGWPEFRGVRTVIFTVDGSDHDHANFICFSATRGTARHKIGSHWPHRSLFFDDMIRFP